MRQRQTAIEREHRFLADRGRAFAHYLERTSQPSTGEELIAWARRFCAHHVQREPSPFHRWLSTELSECDRKRGTHVNAIAPRGAAKSTWVSILYPLRCVLEGTEPYVVLASESEEQAKGFLNAIKYELEENEAIARQYPDAAGRGREWSKRTIVTKNGCRILAIGTGGRLRGRREREFRPTLVVCDDLEGDLAQYSEQVREKAWSWLTRSALNVGTKNTNYVVVGTMLHEDCVVGRLEKQSGWRSGKFRALVTWPQDLDAWAAWEKILADEGEAAALTHYEKHRAQLDAGAVVLWPEEEPLLSLMLRRAKIGPTAFLAEKQNEPVPPGAVRFDQSWFDGEDLEFLNPPEKSIAFCAVDPCVGKSEKQGDLAAIVWGWWKPGDRHIYLDADLKRRPSTETNERVVALHKVHGFALCAYESNGFQGEVAAHLLELAAKSGAPLNVYPVEHMTPKLARIQSLEPLLAARHFKFRSRSAGSALLRKHLKYFAVPKIEPYDGPDALEMLTSCIRLYMAQGNGGDDTMRVSGNVIRR